MAVSTALSAISPTTIVPSAILAEVTASAAIVAVVTFPVPMVAAKLPVPVPWAAVAGEDAGRECGELQQSGI